MVHNGVAVRDHLPFYNDANVGKIPLHLHG